MNERASGGGGSSESGFWDSRFDRPEFVYGESPNAFLAGWAPGVLTSLLIESLPASPPWALCLGDGEGRNGVWLAELGFQVTAVDFSAVALEKARDLAARRGVTLETICADLTDWRWPKGQVDLLVNIFLHMPPEAQPTLHARSQNALRPGGYGLFVLFDEEQCGRGSGGPPRLDMLYTPERLRAALPDLTWDVLQKREVDLDEGGWHRGAAMLVEGLGRRLAPSSQQD